MTNTNIKVVSNVNQSNDSQHIFRRGIDSGYVQLGERLGRPDADAITRLWQANHPVFIPEVLTDKLSEFAGAIAQSRLLYKSVLNEEAVDDILDAPPYSEFFGERFQILSSRFDEADRQEIISVDFDVMDGDTLLMEDIWLRISWLSYHDEDESIRFRFSFGMENFDDVSTDPERQLGAAELSQCVFPESAIITQNPILNELVSNTINTKTFNFVERIVYFNAPNGGAQFHHDAEKGHLGVVYAQITGETFWIALSRAELIDEVIRFASSENNLTELKTEILDKTVAEQNEVSEITEVSTAEDKIPHFIASLKDKELISELLDDPANEEISALLNESKTFFDQLVGSGYAYHLTPGDIILLPQASMDNCAWHSVFCIGDEAGEALSFAIKPV